MLEEQKKKPSEYEFSQKTQNKHSKSQNIIIKVLLPPTVYLTDKCNIPCRTGKQATANKPCHFTGKDGKYLHCSFSNCFEPPGLNHPQRLLAVLEALLDLVATLPTLLLLPFFS